MDTIDLILWGRLPRYISLGSWFESRSRSKYRDFSPKRDPVPYLGSLFIGKYKGRRKPDRKCGDNRRCGSKQPRTVERIDLIDKVIALEQMG